MKEARKNRRPIVVQDVRQLGLLLLLAGIVAFFFDSDVADADSLKVVAAGFGVWCGAVLIF